MTHTLNDFIMNAFEPQCAKDIFFTLFFYCYTRCVRICTTWSVQLMQTYARGQSSHTFSCNFRSSSQIGWSFCCCWCCCWCCCCYYYYVAKKRVRVRPYKYPSIHYYNTRCMAFSAHTYIQQFRTTIRKYSHKIEWSMKRHTIQHSNIKWKKTTSNDLARQQLEYFRFVTLWLGT